MSGHPDETGSTHRASIDISTGILRNGLRDVEEHVRALVDTLQMHATYTMGGANGPEHRNRREAIAQAMLALRHVEDARMRLGKVMQYALQGGEPYGGKEPA